jgi:hypothetical protein
LACWEVQDHGAQRFGFGSGEFPVLVEAEELELGDQVGGDVCGQQPC